MLDHNVVILFIYFSTLPRECDETEDKSIERIKKQNLLMADAEKIGEVGRIIGVQNK